MHDLQPTDSDARALTGVSGLDQLLGGGLPAQRLHLIEGHPGKRTGSHESTIREYAIGPDRVRVGEPLADFHGVMTGVPQDVGPSGPLLHKDGPAGR